MLCFNVCYHCCKSSTNIMKINANKIAKDVNLCYICDSKKQEKQTYKIMKTIQQLLEKLNGVKIHSAGTGSIYVYYKNLKVRISNHEPNYTVPNRSNDKCFYIQDACGNKFDIYDIVLEVAQYLQIEITGTLKGMMTRHFHEKMQLKEEAYKIKCEHEAYMQAYNEQRAVEMAELRMMIEANRNEVEKIIARAEAYGSLGANGDKRRKRAKNFFKHEFAARFGIEVNLVDVREIINK